MINSTLQHTMPDTMAQLHLKFNLDSNVTISGEVTETVCRKLEAVLDSGFY